MSTRTLLSLTLLLAGFGCKTQDQGPPAQEPQGEAAQQYPYGETAPPDESRPAAGAQQGYGTPGQQGTTGQQGAGTTGQQGYGTGQQGYGTGQQQGHGAGQQGTTGQQAPGAAATLVEINCSQAGAPQSRLSVSAPPGASCKESGGALIISAGDEFQLVVREAAADMATRKKAIESDTTRRFRRYTMNTPNAVIYEIESSSGTPEYNFFATTTVGNRQLVCEGQPGQGHTQAQAETMIRACQSLSMR